MQQYVEEQKESNLGKLRNAFSRGNLKLISVMLFITATGHVSCTPIVIQYGSLILRQYEKFVNGKVFVSVYSSCMVLASVISLFTVKIFGRRTMMLCGIFLSGLIQQCCAVLFYMEDVYDNSISYLAVQIAVLLVIHLLVTSTMYGAGMVVLKAEIFPHNSKEFYGSLLCFTHDTVSFVVVKSFISLSTKLRTHFLFLIFSTFAYVTAIVVYLFICDTKGKTLYQIRRDYMNVEVG